MSEKISSQETNRKQLRESEPDKINIKPLTKDEIENFYRRKRGQLLTLDCFKLIEAFRNSGQSIAEIEVEGLPKYNLYIRMRGKIKELNITDVECRSFKEKVVLARTNLPKQIS